MSAQPSSGTLESESKKDPVMDEDILFPGMSGFKKVRKSHTFELDFSQYITIVEESYKAVTTCDPDLKTLVPLSAYQYYMVIALWRRLYQMVPPRCGLSTYEDMTEVLPEMPLPKEVRLYLEAVGNIKDEEHGTWHLYFDPDILTDQEHGSAQGSFGKVDEKTHVTYETMPAPIVALLAMKEDISYSTGWASRQWQLPEDMTPDTSSEHVPDCPTVNLLGYCPATKLTEDQSTMLKDNGILVSRNGYHFDVINIDRIPIAQRLITFLAGQLSSAKCAMEVFNSTSTSGSLAQVPFTTWVPVPLNPVYSNKARRAVQESGITCSHRMMAPHIACAAAVFRFRFKRLTKECTKNIFAHDFDKGNILPAWHRNENSVFNKAPVHWNQDNFTTEAQNGRSLAAQLAENTHRQHRE